MTDSAAIEQTLLALCRARGPGKTICPSEAARALAGAGDDWRALMPAIRCEAARLAREGRLRATQKGRRVDPAAVVGPFRLGL